MLSRFFFVSYAINFFINSLNRFWKKKMQLVFFNQVPNKQIYLLNLDWEEKLVNWTEKKTFLISM